MSRNSGYSRNKKSQSAKPYNVENSFVKRLTSRVTGYIPKLGSWSWFGAADTEAAAAETNHAVNVNDEDAEIGEEATNTYGVTREALNEHRHLNSQSAERQEHGVPPHKRARTDFSIQEDQQIFSSSNNLSISAIQNDSGEPSGMGRRPIIEPQAGSSRTPQVAVAGPSGVHRLMMVPKPGTSGLHLRKPVASSTPAQPRSVPAYNTEMNGDNLSDSSESTSGCSSLVPQGGRSDSEQPRNNTTKHTLPSNSLSSSFIKQPLHEQRSLFNASGRDLTRPQPPAVSKRPSFDLSIMSAPPRPPSASDKADNTLSPFYHGKTCYGGASAYRKTNVSYDSIVNNSRSRSPSRFKGLNSVANMASPRRLHISPPNRGVSPMSATQSEPCGVSSVTKRILDTLETLSSPVSDCSRIPLDDCGLGIPLKRKRAADDLYTYHSPPTQRQGGPPITPLQVPTVHELMKMKEMQAKILDSTNAARTLTKPKNKPAWQENKVSYSLRQDESGGSRHTNKMKRKQKDDDDELPEEVNLPNISLQISGLPKFELPPFSSTVSSSNSVNTGDSMTFTFSSPIVVKTPSKNNFKLGSTQLNNSIPVTSKSEPLKLNWANSSNKTNCSNIPTINSTSPLNKSETKHNGGPKSVTSNSDNMPLLNQETKSTNSLSSMFKPEAGSWVCDVCDVRNKSADSSCVACTSPRPSAAPKTSVAPVSTPLVATLPVISTFGAQFSRAGKWECDGCFNLNENSLQKCPSCSTPNPKASTSTSASSTQSLGFGDKFKKPSNSWECSVCLVVNTATASQCISCESQRENTTGKSSLTNAPQFTFGIPKTSTSETKPSTTFQFGIPASEKNDKPSASDSMFGPPKPFTFGIPPPAAANTPVTPTPSSTMPIPAFSFSSPQSKTEQSTEKKIVTFPTQKLMFTPPKTEASPSLKRPAESEPQGFTFGSTGTREESSKPVFPLSVSNTKETEKLQASDGEPSSKKSFTFSPVTSKVEEPSKAMPPLFMFGSTTTSNANKTTSDSPSFTFTPSSTTAPVTEAKPSSALFSFGATSNAVQSGPGFSSKDAKSPVIFGAKTTVSSESNKLFGFKSPATDDKSFSSKGNPPAYGSPVTTTSTPMFGASAGDSSTFTSPVTTSSGPVHSFGNASPAFGTPKTTSSLPSFGVLTTTASASSVPPFCAGVSASTFGKPITTAASGPAFGATSTPMFGAVSDAPSKAPPPFEAGPKPVTFGTPTTTSSSTPMFGSTNTQAPMFGAPSATPNSVFGAPATSMFGTEVTKSVTFGDAAKTANVGATSNSGFAFGSKPTAPNTSSPAPFQFSGGQNTTPAVGGFAFGANTGAPVNNNQTTFGFGSSNNATGFGNTASAFASSKPIEAAPMFGATPAPAFGGSAAPAAAQAFGTTTPQFGETTNSFQTPNFAFGSAQPSASASTFNFSGGQNASNVQNAAPPSLFAFGQPNQNQQQQQQAAAPPQFNPNIRPSFNFTGGNNNGPPVFSATPTPQTGASANVQQRRFKRATRRIQNPR